MQVVKYFEYCLRVFLFYRNKQIELVNIHSLGLLPLGVFLKVFYRAKLVYDTHELETETDGLIGIRQKLSKFLERRLIRHTDMTLVVSENIATWYANEYSMPRPSVVLNAPHRRELKTNNHFREQLGIRDDQIILLYQGGLAEGRGVSLIIDAMKARVDDTLVAVFMGYGDLEAEIKASAVQHSNIYFYPAVAPQVVLEYTSSADVGIHLIQNTCLNHDYCMPNKLFEYAMAGLPVLVSNMKEMSELVINNGMGAVISDFSPAGINLALDEFLQKDLVHMKANAYHVAVSNAWEVQEQKMLKAYQGLWQ
ncbi:glycosyltransferase [Alcaligenes endophyticus]|uniref:Glycosyltransferase n=1 Tax=Alcaligenes endophyticus TaxID=1929088 RepID=A0ABT8EFT7_9BURK|nr:glycosyltransferase [Alcaligenes endophyticus]MCX5590190.1 glycosyltransferase [Alcaligenes endophyticus]MDN4120147.1 glycosyltransferase [Alcaligenes endophyticus]